MGQGDGDPRRRAGRPGPDLVETAIATALDSDGTPLRWPVGQDAELIDAARTGTDQPGPSRTSFDT